MKPLLDGIFKVMVSTKFCQQSRGAPGSSTIGPARQGNWHSGAQRVPQHVDVALRLRVAAGVGRAPAVREVDEEARAQPGRVGVARLREHQDHDEVGEGEDQPVTD